MEEHGTIRLLPTTCTAYTCFVVTGMAYGILFGISELQSPAERSHMTTGMVVPKNWDPTIKHERKSLSFQHIANPRQYGENQPVSLIIHQFICFVMDGDTLYADSMQLNPKC